MSSVPKYNSAAANSHGDHVGHLVRVLIAEDEPLVRSALSNFIDGEGSLSLVGAAADAVEAIDLATTLRPDVAIIDVKMPGGGGPVAAREIRARSPHTRVVALSGFEDLHSVEEMLRAGATSYLVKGTPGVDLVDAVHNAPRGHGSLSVQVAGDLLREALRIKEVRRIELEAGLDEVGERYGVEAFHRLGDAFRVGTRYGTPMSALLADFAGSMRAGWHAEYRERITRAPVVMTVPALVFFGGLTMREAIGTSLFVIAVNCAAGVLGHLSDGDADWKLTLVVACLAVGGALAGTALSHRVHHASLCLRR